MRTKHTFRLPPDLAGKLADYAARRGVPQALVVEAALASHLSPDGADRLEAALARQLDRMSRGMERLERHVTISNEALAVFVRFWLPTPQRRWRSRRESSNRPFIFTSMEVRTSPTFVSSSTVAESATRMRTSSVIGDLPPTAEC